MFDTICIRGHQSSCQILIFSLSVSEIINNKHEQDKTGSTYVLYISAGKKLFGRNSLLYKSLDF